MCSYTLMHVQESDDSSDEELEYMYDKKPYVYAHKSVRAHEPACKGPDAKNVVHMI